MRKVQEKEDLTRMDERGVHRYEDEGLQVVLAIRRDYAPDLTGDDGGQILAWILELVDQACDEQQRELLAALKELEFQALAQGVSMTPDLGRALITARVAIFKADGQA